MYLPTMCEAPKSILSATQNETKQLLVYLSVPIDLQFQNQPRNLRFLQSSMGLISLDCGSEGMQYSSILSLFLNQWTPILAQGREDAS